ncbi:MAG TPA: TylF/MycF/NovP-related O-methyltransferase [Gemmata sp.]|nr:TylF/MycF/NovP-related O-methyltransferase [Gemmata sp.]
MRRLIRGAVRAFGFDVVRYRPQQGGPTLPEDLAVNDRSILERIAEYSMTSVERQAALVSTVRYLVRRNVKGCVVECGVWRGGSSMAVALALLQENAADRDLYLFDTFEGMTPPTEVDRTADGISAQTHLDNDISKTGYWCVAGIDDVRRNMTSTCYPESRVHLVKGPVETTIPEQSPAEPIALLRLDTDWYESTRHELIHLFPRLVEGGILIVDDYGHWAGARKAVDEYLSELPDVYYLHRIDYTGRLLIKQ